MTDVISFPGLGLEFEINRVALTIGNIEIYWYAICIATGFVLALLFFYKNAKEFGIDMDRGVDVILSGMLLGVLGARAYFVAFKWDIYKDNLSEIFNIRGGGLGFYGGIIGGIIGIALACKLRRVPLRTFLDMAAGGVLIAQGFGRWGNFFNSECFGKNTDLPWGMTGDKISAYILTHSTEQMGAEMDALAPVHPTFLYEFIWCMLGFAVYLLILKKRRYDGEMFIFYIGWNGFGRMLIEGLRTDSLMWGNLRVSQVLGGLMALSAIIILMLMRKKIRAKNDPDYLVLWRDTEAGKYMPFGQWDYKTNAPKVAFVEEEAPCEEESIEEPSSEEGTEAEE